MTSLGPPSRSSLPLTSHCASRAPGLREHCAPSWLSSPPCPSPWLWYVPPGPSLLVPVPTRRLRIWCSEGCFLQQAHVVAPIRGVAAVKWPADYGFIQAAFYKFCDAV